MDKLKVKTKWTIYKFYDPDGRIADSLKAGRDVFEFTDNLIAIEEIDGNILLNTGATEIWNLVIGASANHYDATNAQIGVGDDSTLEDATQTDLLGLNTAYVGMDTGYPVVNGNTVTFRSTFDGNTANFAWNEYVIKHAVSGICLNRKVESKGTKVAGETWTLSVELSIS